MFDGLRFPGRSHQIVIHFVSVLQMIAPHVEDIGQFISGIRLGVPVRIADLEAVRCIAFGLVNGLAAEHLKVTDLPVED